METTNKKQNVKLVMIAGMLIPESKVEGRLKSLANGRRLKGLLHSDQKEEDKRLADEGYTPTEINCLRHQNRIQQMENMGLGTSSRVKRVYRPI